MSAFCSTVSQVLKVFPRTEFQALVTRTHAEPHARDFPCWRQFVAMLSCQPGSVHSRREICGGLRSSEDPRGTWASSPRSASTLACANQHRSWPLNRAMFGAPLLRWQPPAHGRKRFRFANHLVSLDSAARERRAAAASALGPAACPGPAGPYGAGIE